MGTKRLLGALPRELLHALLVCIGHGRLPPPPATRLWELVNEGDDGLLRLALSSS